MDRLYQQVETIIANAKKSSGRPYSLETVESKRNELEALQLDANTTLDSLKLTEEDKNDQIERFADLKRKALDILQIHEDKVRQTDGNNAEEESRETDTMAANALNTSELASISKLLPTFDGNKDNLEPFIANLEIIKETISAEKRNSFFNYVFRTKLTTRVQNRVRQVSVPTDVETLLSSIKKAYSVTKSPNVILNELTRMVQSETIRKFADRIETLTMELNEVQVGALGEASRETITNTNAMIAFNAFKNGLKNREIVRTIEASRTKTLHEAIGIALEASSDIRQTQVMFQTTQTRNSYGQNGNSNGSMCSRCGGRHGDKCYADGKNCSKCGKMNHFAKMCKSRGNNSNRDGNNGYNGNRTYQGNNQNNGNFRSHNGNNRGRGNNRNNGNSRNYNSNDNRGNNGSYNDNRNHNVRHIQEQGNSQSPEILEYQESSEQNQ